jgi:hypothetical protein
LNRKGIFIKTLIATIFARYVLLPLLIPITNYYYYSRSITPPDSTAVNEAVLLMTYELFVIAFVFYLIFYLYRNKSLSNTGEYKLINLEHFRDRKRIQFKFAENYFGYLVFFVLTVILIALFPSALFNFNFLRANENLVSSFTEEGLLYSITIYCIMTLKNFMFIGLIYKASVLYKKNGSYIWVLSAIILVFLNTSIFYGISRLDIIVTFITSTIVFYKLFNSKKIFIPLVIMALVVLSIFQSVTVARGIVGVKESTSFLWDLADNISIYLGGPYNVAMAIETAQFFPESRNISVFLFDIFRPMIGVNILIKDMPILYSNIYFNERISGGIRVTQIIPMIGQGYLFFGFVGAPIIGIFFIWLAKKFTVLSLKLENSRIEIVYIVTLSCIRLGFMLGQNTMNQVNDMSMNLFLFLIVYWINNKLIYKKISDS